jgi:hypothetical protein
MGGSAKLEGRICSGLKFNIFANMKDILNFLLKRKKFWLLPMIIILLLLGVIIVIGGSSAVAPFIYTLF